MRSLMLWFVVGCGARSGPQPALTAYLTAEQRGDYRVAHALLTAEDQRARPVEDYVAEHLSAGPLWLAVAARTTFTIGRPEDRGDHTAVPVKATHAEQRQVAEAIGGLPTEQLERAPDPAAAMRAWIETELDRRPFPTVTESLTYGMRQEGSDWRVWLGLARQDAAVAAMTRARALTRSGEVDAARAAWAAVLELPPDPAGTVDTLKAHAREVLDVLAATAAEVPTGTDAPPADDAPAAPAE